ncbi:hypothetical protein HU200_060418 [Digitaria exilis]|uniref:Uncharacterized protein n=1 Tax=Digitaria exilis TaxID=1010633 RepID=A0A835A6N0_9POAL|nr:hypothetical protein HU200_060418 [Digitaria exilis]
MRKDSFGVWKWAQSCDSTNVLSWLETTAKEILAVGGMGHIGKHIDAASARLGHPTSILIREVAPSNPVKAQLPNMCQAKPSNREICSGAVAEQTRIIAAVKEAGNAKLHTVDLAESRVLSKPTSHGEAEVIPHPTVSCNTSHHCQLQHVR